MKEEQKVSFIHSISAKIMLLTVLAVVMSVLIVAFRAEAGAKKVVGDVSADYILSMAEMGVEIVNNLPQEADAGAYENALADISMEGIDSSYAYLVDTDGTMLYHPTAEKIGQPVENAVVLGVVAELAKGQVPVNETVTYDFKGVTKYAAYAITANRQIVVVTADEDEIMKPLNQIVSKIMLLSLGILAAAIVLAYVVSQFICRPIQQITTIIVDTAQLDFRSNPNGAKLRSRRDETGEMANAVHVMRRNLRSMIGDIDTASNQITQNVDGLQEITTTVDHMCSDNSATSQQLAAGMEETAASSDTVKSMANEIEGAAKNIATRSQEGAQQAADIHERASKAQTTARKQREHVAEVHRSIREGLTKALEDAGVVKQIEVLSSSIMEITSQTNLLALNASIEAARAGDAGRGFAVVATEIGGLAEQSKEAVVKIQQVTEAVTASVERLSEDAGQLLEFVGGDVVASYDMFDKVVDAYNQDAKYIDMLIGDFSATSEELLASIDGVLSSMDGIATATNEGAKGTTDIAQKTIDVKAEADSVTAEVERCDETAKKLMEEIGVFKI